MREENFKGKTILVIGAHPDDNDFGAGATVAKAAKQGAKIIYIVATLGQRGSSDSRITPDDLAKIRTAEQVAASKVLGVKKVIFLGYCDGELDPNLELKEKIVKLIRKYKPDIVITMDPSKFYYKEYGFINHSDHRAIGEATLDAAYPLARDLLSFPEHKKEGLAPHKVKELWMPSFLPEDANHFIDVTQTFEIKIRALARHKTQIGNVPEMKTRMQGRAEVLGKKIGVKLAEGFIRLKLPK